MPMNPIVRHFLPSVVRGVYRIDSEFSKIRDQDAFNRFCKAKLRFLPLGLSDKIQTQLGLNHDFDSVDHQQIPPRAIQVAVQRARDFFEQHTYFHNALGTPEEIEGADNFLEVQFVRRVLAPLMSDAGFRKVQPQRGVGPYRVDFALEGTSRFAIEVDGFGKFRNRRDLDNFTERQNYITSQGWRVIRYTYSQIMDNTAVTLKDLHTLLKDDADLNRFLTTQWNTDTTLTLFTRPTGPQVVDVVNDFYHVQDCFVETALASANEVETFCVRDNFGFDIPFIALAISSLYEFLEAVESVVDVDFDLPAVEISGVPCSEEWAADLHRLVEVTGSTREGAHAWDAPTVRLKPASLPAPASEAWDIRFCANLSLDEIQERLQYFCHDVFGYERTKDFQNKVLQRIFDGQPTLGISATGSGKSFCFWLPALLKPGLTLVICPLRSLMRDQRLTLRNYGISSVEFINSDVDRLDQRRILEEVKLGYIRLLYIAPERLRIKKFLDELEQLKELVPINFLAIDEAHCISEWGHDFRPSYLKLPFLRERLSESNKRPLLIALTATAGQQVEQDMLGILKFRGGEDGHVIRERVADREKFSYQIVQVVTGSEKTTTYHDILTKCLPKALRQQSLTDLLQLENQRMEKAVGIVFCIYADPHGKHSIRDGVAHYLYETMGELEPEMRFDEMAGWVPKYREDAYGTGKVRAFSSKTPTLCPECLSYEYASRSRGVPVPEEGEEALADEEQEPEAQAGRVKVCGNCGHRFEGTEVCEPKNWEQLIEANQEDFRESRFDILVATKGFGMGIDKSSVRFVIHTSLPSGIESWYQEVGRAGRDNERAHIVLLVDPPNKPCLRELDRLDYRPRCSYSGGCPHGKENLCDYGKQHMFITGSYPGVESDAVNALRVLDKLIVARTENRDGSVFLGTSRQYLSYTELAVYRLMILGLVEDYAVTYQQRNTPHFDVEFLLSGSPEEPSTMVQVQRMMQNRLSEYLSHFDSQRNRSIESDLELRIKEYQPLEALTAKTRHFATIGRYKEFFQVVYQHLLLLLDHTYKYVVKMRYTMLKNLHDVVKSHESGECRRKVVLSHFTTNNVQYQAYCCGLCDVCVPTLDFALDARKPPTIDVSTLEREEELADVLEKDDFQIQQIQKLVYEFRDYPTVKYRQAQAILQGNATNLSALFLAREFSPPEEYEGNTRRLLRTANQEMLPFPEVRSLFNSSKAFKSELLLSLNEAGTACDTPEGWSFLVEQATEPEHHRNTEVAAMRECLDFMLLVEEDLAEGTASLKHKARELENAFYA